MITAVLIITLINLILICTNEYSNLMRSKALVEIIHGQKDEIINYIDNKMDL